MFLAEVYKPIESFIAECYYAEYALRKIKALKNQYRGLWRIEEMAWEHFENCVDAVSLAILYYTVLACAGESRWARRKAIWGDGSAILVFSLDGEEWSTDDAPTDPYGRARAAKYVLGIDNPKAFLQACVRLFDPPDGRWYWCKGYGGKSWARIARHGLAYDPNWDAYQKFRWIDTAVALQHNMACFLNKLNVWSVLGVNYHSHKIIDNLPYQLAGIKELPVKRPLFPGQVYSLSLRRIFRALAARVPDLKIWEYEYGVWLMEPLALKHVIQERWEKNESHLDWVRIEKVSRPQPHDDYYDDEHQHVEEEKDEDYDELETVSQRSG